MLTVSVSDILTYQKCPSLWAYTRVTQRRPRRETEPALAVGSAFHTFAELAANNPRQWSFAQVEAHLKDFLRQDWGPKGIDLEGSHWDKAEKQIQQLSLPASFYFSQPLPFEVLETEYIELTETKLKVHGHWVCFVLRTKMDVIAKDSNGLWHVQWKTLSPRDDQHREDYVHYIRSSPHESAYKQAIEAYGLKKNLNLPYMGTKLVVFEKTAPHHKAKGERCSHCDKAGLVLKDPRDLVKTYDLLVTPKVQQKNLENIAMVVEQMQRAYGGLLKDWDHDEDPSPLEQRPENCLHFTGRLCPYRSVCDGLTPITDPLAFEDYNVNERYELGVSQGN